MCACVCVLFVHFLSNWCICVGSSYLTCVYLLWIGNLTSISLNICISKCMCAYESAWWHDFLGWNVDVFCTFEVLCFSFVKIQSRKVRIWHNINIDIIVAFDFTFIMDLHGLPTPPLNIISSWVSFPFPSKIETKKLNKTTDGLKEDKSQYTTCLINFMRHDTVNFFEGYAFSWRTLPWKVGWQLYMVLHMYIVHISWPHS